LLVVSAFTAMTWREESRGSGSEPRSWSFFAELAGRIVAAVDGRRQELSLLELAELVDVRIGLDDRIPELLVRIAEHLLLLDLLDVDVLHRIAHLVEGDGATQRVELHRLELLDELLGAGELAVVLLDDLVDHAGAGVVGLRIIRRHLAELGAVGLHEGLVLRVFQRGAVLQRGDMADHLVTHRGQHEFVIARAAADHRLLVAGGGELLGKLQRHWADHQREDRVGVLLDGRDVGPEILGADRRPDFLDDLAATSFERPLEAADHLVTEGIGGADRDDLLIALVAGPLSERVAWLR